MITKAQESYTKFINEVSEILGIGKPADILRLCKAASIFEYEIREQAFIAGREYERTNRRRQNDSKRVD
ncbi:MAG: hypothetical protein ACTTI6_03230 [Treponema sp.]|uniref:hypothetical protein n=1 Tax=Treponema sp. TaxID=166 RepID=UPI003FA30440